ncbi:TfoX/Sxy family protein [Larkinella sp. GY13]|uniref:TfoX/Sxy family protein n=1 Tax=Larkinella sp. GY13 TaxID=3453720 RepID=UPI003EEA2E57
MPYTEETAHRIRQILVDKGVDFTEKKMFSGLCFLVDDKLFCATHFDKKRDEDLLLCRVGTDAYETALEENDCIPMDFSGKTMKGYVYVTENGFRSPKELERWLQRCLDYNPLAKKSKANGRISEKPH